MPESRALRRALDSQSGRLERGQARRRSNSDRASRTTYSQGGGRYRQLGGNDGYPLRRSATSGSAPSGQRVPNNDGIVDGMPSLEALRKEVSDAFKNVANDLGQIAADRGPQRGTFDPNDREGDDSGIKLPPRYPQDHYFRDNAGILYQWRTSAAGTEDGAWEVISAATNLLTVGIQRPAVQQYPVIGSNDIPRIVETLQLQNKNSDGTTATTGTGALLINGGAVVLGETVLDAGGYLALNVTSAGEGILIATVTLRPV